MAAGGGHAALDSGDFFGYLRPVEQALRDALAVPGGDVGLAGRSPRAGSGTEAATPRKADAHTPVDRARLPPGLETSPRLLSRLLAKRPPVPDARGQGPLTAEPRTALEARLLDAQLLQGGPGEQRPVVVHEFSVSKSGSQPSAPGAPKKGKAKGRGKAARILGAGVPVPSLPSGWRTVPLADVLFNIGVGRDAAGWCSAVTDPASGALLPGMASVLEVLRQAGMEQCSSQALEASWPTDAASGEWRALPVWAVGRRRPPDDGDVRLVADDARVCDVVFRADAGDSLEAEEALRVRLRVWPHAAVRALGAQGRQEEPGNQCAAAYLEWRPEAWRKPRKRKQCEGEPRFHIPNNREDRPAEQPPHFKRWPLRREQLQSLGWMQRREAESHPFHLVAAQRHQDTAGLEAGDVQAPAAKAACGWRYAFRYREVYDIRGGILGDALGYGKTATTIGLISRTPAPAPLAAKIEHFFAAAATLILVPSNLLDQWCSEFAKFTCTEGVPGASAPPPLRLLVIKTVTQLKAITAREVCTGVDVVLCSYRLLFSPVYRRRLLELSGDLDAQKLTQSAAVQRSADVAALRDLTRRFLDNPSTVGWISQSGGRADDGNDDPPPPPRKRPALGEDPMRLKFPVLEQFWWARVVFDEFHELEVMGAEHFAQFESLRNLCGSCRWGLTGTPPTRDLAQIGTLARLFQLGELPVPRPDDEGLAAEMAQRFLDHFARQNTSREVVPVQLREHIIMVDQTNEERMIYLQALHDSAQRLGSAGAPHPSAGGVGGAADAPAMGDSASPGVEQLLKLCSHFSYSSGAVGHAGAECSRLLASKKKHLDRAKARLEELAPLAELVWRHAEREPAPLGADAAAVERPARELLLPSLRERLGVAAATAGAEAPDAPDPATVGACPEMGIVEASSSGVDAPEQQGKAGVGGPKEDVFEAAAAALDAARRLPAAELRRRCEARMAAAPGGDSGQLRDVLAALLQPSASILPPSISSEHLRQAAAELQANFGQLAEACEGAARSHNFFRKALAATRGEESGEHRTCAVCLDEDIPCEQLSITTCAHVFHSTCILDVARQMGNCPTCRHRLDPARDVTPLAAELAAADRAAGRQPPAARRGGAGGDADEGKAAECARRCGSKLAAIARHLREINGNGEKAIVFCQWEDLKKKVASTLSECGIRHYELRGSAQQRGDTIRRFQEEPGEGCTSVLLLSLEHSASGTNLTAANHVIFVHPMCAASAERAVAYEAQAIGRCRRWGQEKEEVHCWRFVTRGTVEEAITADHQRDLWRNHIQGSDVPQ